MADRNPARRFLLQLILAILLVPLLAAPPAKALWKLGPNSYGSPEEACEQYVAGLGASWEVVGMAPNYNGWGAYIGEICFILFKINNSITPAGIYVQCNPGEVVNYFALPGCTTLAPPAPKNNAPPQCKPNDRSLITVGNPITVLVGNKSEEAVDFATAGPDVLELRRTYNTFDSQKSMLGRGWRSTFDRRIGFESGGVRNLIRANGQIARFLFSSPLSDWADMDLRLAQVGSDWQVTDREGTVETYNSSGILTSIKKRNGYTQSLSYDASGRLDTVTDSYGRQITFTHTPDNLLASATGPDGKVVSYTYRNTTAYSSAYLLETVIYPDDTAANPNDNPRITYHYENANFPYALTGITDERGIRIVTWTYDSNGRATQSERAGSVERDTISFDVGGTVTRRMRSTSRRSIRP